MGSMWIQKALKGVCHLVRKMIIQCNYIVTLSIILMSTTRVVLMILFGALQVFMAI